MAEVKEGDFVLLEHEALYDRFHVRRVSKVNRIMIETERLDADSDGYTHPMRRKKTAVVGVFSSEEMARDAQMRLEPLYRSLGTAIKDAKIAFMADIHALVR